MRSWGAEPVEKEPEEEAEAAVEFVDVHSGQCLDREPVDEGADEVKQVLGRCTGQTQVGE